MDAAVIGYIDRCGEGPIVIYSEVKMMKIFMKRDGMTADEASEYISFNVEGGWLGKGTPGLLHRATMDEIDEMIG